MDSTTTEIYNLCKSLLTTVTLIALKFHGKVANDIKETSDLTGTIEDQARTTAKTDIDELIQDIFLHKLIEGGMSQLVSVDVEEQSDLVEKFTNTGKYKFILDPIDGTLNYLDGNDDNFSINVALVSKLGIEFSIVAFPMFNSLFTNRKGEYTVGTLAESLGINFQNKFIISEDTKMNSNLIQHNRRTPEELLNKLMNNAMEVIPSNGLYFPILDILAGHCDALIAGTPMVRDILLHEIIAGLYPDVFEIFDFSGNPMDYYSEQRLKEFVFSKKGRKSLFTKNFS